MPVDISATELALSEAQRATQERLLISGTACATVDNSGTSSEACSQERLQGLAFLELACLWRLKKGSSLAVLWPVACGLWPWPRGLEA